MTDQVDLDKLRELAQKASWPRNDPGAIDNYGSLVIDNRLLVEILDERADALARIAKVEALHVNRYGRCWRCDRVYPCASMRALTGEGRRE